MGGRKGIRPVKNIRRWWRWALVSPDGVAPSRMVSVSASVNLTLHHKVQKFSSGTGSPGWSRKKGRKTVVCAGVSVNVVYCLDTAVSRNSNTRYLLRSNATYMSLYQHKQHSHSDSLINTGNYYSSPMTTSCLASAKRGRATGCSATNMPVPLAAVPCH